MSTHFITIRVSGPAGLYLEELHHALTELMKLVYSSREIDLQQDQTEALYFVSDFLQSIVSKRDEK